MHHSYYWLWVGNGKLINGLIVADTGASLYAEAQAYCYPPIANNMSDA